MNTGNNQARNFPMSDNFLTSYDNIQNVDKVSASQQSQAKMHLTEADSQHCQRSPDLAIRDHSRSRKKFDKQASQDCNFIRHTSAHQEQLGYSPPRQINQK